MSKTKVQTEEDQTKKGRSERTSWYQQEAILQWLEIESNFNWLNGEATKGMKMVVAGAKVSKSSALQELADHVNEKCGTKWHKDKARETLRSYKDTYKKVKNQFEDVSGGKFCLTEDELARGLTIDKKLEKMCYGYSRMDQLYGNKQNVKPFSTMQSGLSMLINAIGSDSEDDEDDVADKVVVVAVKDVDDQVKVDLAEAIAPIH